MPINTLGAVPVFDGGVPRTVTAKCNAVISGGDFVFFDGTANGVGSQISSYSPDDLVAAVPVGGHFINGIALLNAESGGYTTVATRGAYLCRAAGICSGGHAVIYVSGTTPGVRGVGLDTTGSIVPIGRSMTPSASGTALYTLVHLFGL